MKKLPVFANEVTSISREFWTLSRNWFTSFTRLEQICLTTSMVTTLLVCIFVLRYTRPSEPQAIHLPPTAEEQKTVGKQEEPFFQIPIPPVMIDYTKAARPTPKAFYIEQKMPAIAEARASLGIDSYSFDPKRDLVSVDDKRVWWESDNDDASGDTEDDHLMHRCIETPFRRLIELVEKEGGRLKVQDTYRAQGVHHPKSLHKQGRALDLTAFDLPLSKLAALCWASGFDWVYYEKRGGHHIHVSKQPDDKQQAQR